MISNKLISLLEELIDDNELLNDRLKRIMKMRYGIPEGCKTYTYKQIGEEYGISYERARQLVILAKRKMKPKKKRKSKK